MVGENEFSVLKKNRVTKEVESKVSVEVPNAPQITSSELPFDVDSLSPEQLKTLLGQVLKKL